MSQTAAADREGYCCRGQTRAPWSPRSPAEAAFAYPGAFHRLVTKTYLFLMYYSYCIHPFFQQLTSVFCLLTTDYWLPTTSITFAVQGTASTVLDSADSGILLP